MGSRSMVWDGMMVSRASDWGCGCDVGFSVMMVVDGVVSGSGSSWMSIIWATRVVEQVRGTVDEMGSAFRTLLGEIPILVFLVIGSLMNASLRISLTSLPVNISCSGSCGNIGNVIFFYSSGCVSSCSSDSIRIEASLLCTSRPELSPIPSS
jgi:hypothetical protein